MWATRAEAEDGVGEGSTSVDRHRKLASNGVPRQCQRLRYGWQVRGCTRVQAGDKGTCGA